MRSSGRLRRAITAWMALHAAPGSDGDLGSSSTNVIPISSANDLDGIVALARREAIDLVVVGPRGSAGGRASPIDSARSRGSPPLAPLRRLPHSSKGSKAFSRRILCNATGFRPPAYAVFDEAWRRRKRIRAIAFGRPLRRKGRWSRRG